MRRFALFSFLGLLFLTGCRNDVSGSYLASDKAAVCWLQLVRTPDNHLTGRMVCATLDRDGNIDRHSITLTGAVDGEHVTLTGGGLLGLFGTTLSGTLNGSILTLSGEQGVPVVLKRASLAEYQAQLEEQQSRAKAITSAKATAASLQARREEEERFISQVYDLIGRMERFDSEADVHLGRFPGALTRYEAITEKVSDYVTRERQLARIPAASVMRAQLVNAATQTSFATDQMYFQGQSLESSLKTNIAPLESRASLAEQSCRDDAAPADGLTSAEIQAKTTACGKLLVIAPTFHQRYSAVAGGLGHLDEVYQREKRTQQALLAEAQRIQH